MFRPLSPADQQAHAEFNLLQREEEEAYAREDKALLDQAREWDGRDRHDPADEFCREFASPIARPDEEYPGDRYGVGEW